jgi:hypothetical protein
MVGMAGQIGLYSGGVNYGMTIQTFQFFFPNLL